MIIDIQCSTPCGSTIIDWRGRKLRALACQIDQSTT